MAVKKKGLDSLIAIIVAVTPRHDIRTLNCVRFQIFHIAPWRNERHNIVTTMDTSPTALFDSYEQDFRQFIETIREKLEDNANNNEGGEGYHTITWYQVSYLTYPPEQQKSTLRRVEMELDEADEMVDSDHL